MFNRFDDFLNEIIYNKSYKSRLSQAKQKVVGGNGGIYSLNYDRLIDLNDKFKFAPRIGFATIGRKWSSIPVEANILWSKKENARHFAEFGLGTTLLYTYSRHFGDKNRGEIIDFEEERYSSRLVLVGSLGYRHQKPQGGFMYRLGLNFLYSRKNGFNPIPLPGVSLGHSF